LAKRLTSPQVVKSLQYIANSAQWLTPSARLNLGLALSPLIVATEGDDSNLLVEETFYLAFCRCTLRSTNGSDARLNIIVVQRNRLPRRFRYPK
jgi:hypothetical protein